MAGWNGLPVFPESRQHFACVDGVSRQPISFLKLQVSKMYCAGAICDHQTYCDTNHAHFFLCFEHFREPDKAVFCHHQHPE